MRKLHIQLFETIISTPLHSEIVDVNAQSSKQEFWYWYLQYWGRYRSQSWAHFLNCLVSFLQTNQTPILIVFPSFGTCLKLHTRCVLSCVFVSISSRIHRPEIMKGEPWMWMLRPGGKWRCWCETQPFWCETAFRVFNMGRRASWKLPLSSICTAQSWSNKDVHC